MKKMLGIIFGAVVIAALGGIGYSIYSLNGNADQSPPASMAKSANTANPISTIAPPSLPQSNPRPAQSQAIQPAKASPPPARQPLDEVETQKILEQIQIMDQQKQEAYAIGDRQRMIELSEQEAKLRTRLKAGR